LPCLWSVLVTLASPAHVIGSSSLIFTNPICFSEWFQPSSLSWAIPQATWAWLSWMFIFHMCSFQLCCL
jgi:hypothetical protein